LTRAFYLATRVSGAAISDLIVPASAFSAGLVWGRRELVSSAVVVYFVGLSIREYEDMTSTTTKIATTTIMNITSIAMVNGYRQGSHSDGYIQCHATGREGVRGQDKHENRRSGDLPIVAPPYPRQAMLCDFD